MITSRFQIFSFGGYRATGASPSYRQMPFRKLRRFRIFFAHLNTYYVTCNSAGDRPDALVITSRFQIFSFGGRVPGHRQLQTDAISEAAAILEFVCATNTYYVTCPAGSHELREGTRFSAPRKATKMQQKKRQNQTTQDVTPAYSSCTKCHLPSK